MDAAWPRPYYFWSSPEGADAHVRAHFEALCVPEVREEWLDEMPFLRRHDDNARFGAESGQCLQFAEGSPISDLIANCPQVEGKRPSVFGGQGDGGEKMLRC